MSRIKKAGIIVIIAYFGLIIAFFGFYSYWNAAPPDRTCMSCHEIEQSYNMWTISAHREINCIECHGTALSNGFHSLKEKSRMVINHFTKESHDNIALNEEQVLAMNQTCRKCHHSEYAGWSAGGHAVNYEHIFLNEEQNTNEQLNHDCLRCHGMFHDGDIHSLIEPVSIEGHWNLIKPEMKTHPVIPCLACHQVHGQGSKKISADYGSPDSAHFKHLAIMEYDTSVIYSKAGFYDMHEKMFINAVNLPKPAMFKGKEAVVVSEDPLMRLCIQCHAPNAWHQAGSSDDRTPTGVHEGISCLACHSKHSNNAMNSCVNCHPAISNCGLDVMTMNTSYVHSESPNNIHFVACGDCHDGKRPLKVP